MEACAQHRAGRLRVPARRRLPLRLPDERRAARRLPLDHRVGHGQHLERALLPEQQEARGRRPGADGLRARLPLLRERHRADVAGRRPLPAVAARAAAVRARVPERRHVAHPARGVGRRRSAPRRSRRWTPVFARTRFSKPVYEAAARKLVETGGGVFSHTVGMAVHDVGGYRGLLKPGQVFSVDPQLWVPEENLYFRYEDTVVVTETGVENFTAFLPARARRARGAGAREGHRADAAGARRGRLRTTASSRQSLADPLAVFCLHDRPGARRPVDTARRDARGRRGGWRHLAQRLADGHLGHVPEACYPIAGSSTSRARAATDRATRVAVADGELSVRDSTRRGRAALRGREGRGRGIADALLRHAEEGIATHFDAAWLAVVEGNRRARRFYERCGWRDIGGFDYQAEIEGGRLPVPSRRYEKRFRRAE